MTVHASKGLEFPNVFIVGLEDNLFPSSMSKDSPAGMEEERRLMYVAITRAEKNCIITYAGSRYRNGETQHSIPSPFIRDIDPQFLILPTGANLGQRVNSAADDFASSNRFYSQPREKYPERNSYGSSKQVSDDNIRNTIKNESRQSVVNYPTKRLTRIDNTSSKPAASSSASVGNVNVGDMISHSRFGKGKVISMEGMGSDAKATIDFENVGTKQLLLKFAKFEIIK